MSQQLRVVHPCTTEWNFLWAALAAHELNHSEKKPTACPNKGEQWGYIGTLVEESREVHQFQHRCHPKIGGEVILRIITTD